MQKTAIGAVLLICASAAASEIQYGQFEVTFTAAELLDQETIDSVSEFMDVNAAVVWSMYVPETYDPSAPAGLMVYISPSDKGWTPKGWRTALEDANLFKGAIYICGAEDRIDKSSELFSQLKNNRYVFLTGSEDFNLTYRIYRKYESAGVKNIELIRVPRMSHSNPDTLYFRKAINYLDQRE